MILTVNNLFTSVVNIVAMILLLTLLSTSEVNVIIVNGFGIDPSFHERGKHNVMDIEINSYDHKRCQHSVNDIDINPSFHDSCKQSFKHIEINSYFYERCQHIIYDIDINLSIHERGQYSVNDMNKAALDIHAFLKFQFAEVSETKPECSMMC